MDYCSICGAEIKNENAAILTMGGSGRPRYICEECEKELDVAISGKEIETITAAIKSLSEKMVNGNPDTPDDVDTAKDMDGAAYHTMTKLLATAIERARKIKDGTYDFSLDEMGDEGFEEIPEELQETEEDRALDERDAKLGELYDKIYNIILIVACSAFAIFLIWKLIDTFLLK